MTKFEDLKEGEKLSETQFYSVVKKGAVRAQFKADDGRLVVLDKEYIDNFLTSSTQFSESKELNRTDAAALFIASPGVALAVNYNTQVDPKKALEAMKNIYPNKKGKMLSEAEYSKKAEEILLSVTCGEERTMIGRHYGSVNEFGRVSFIDMEKEKDPTKSYDTRTRQVDPRTINWMIIKGVKYKVKK